MSLLIVESAGSKTGVFSDETVVVLVEDVDVRVDFVPEVVDLDYCPMCQNENG